MFILTYCFWGYHKFEKIDWQVHSKGFEKLEVIKCCNCGKVKVVYEDYFDGIGSKRSNKLKLVDKK